MKELLKNRMAVSMAAALMVCLFLAPVRPTEQSFLFPEITAFTSIEIDEEKTSEKREPRFFIFDFLWVLFCSDDYLR